MKGKSMMMTTVALGAAYLLKDKKSRDKIIGQFQAMKSRKK